MMRRRALFIFVLAGITALSLGCGPGRSMPVVRMPVAQKQATIEKPKHKALPGSGNAKFDIIRPFFTKYIQRNEGLVDPFKSNLAMFAPKVSVVVTEAKQQKKENPKTPLEYHDLSYYRLTAIISGTALPKALVVDGKGNTYVVKLGTPIGNLGGRVTAITDDGIVVEQPGKPPVTMKLMESKKEMAKLIESMYEY